MKMTAKTRYEHELVDPELLEIRSQLITLLQNALRRDSYVGLSTIGIIGEALAADTKYIIWVEDHATDEHQFVELLTKDDQQRDMIVAAANRLREDRNNEPFQRALRELMSHLTEVMREGPPAT